MCVISDASGVLGLGGIIGGTRTGTALDTKNVLIESAYFNPRSIRKSSKKLNIDTDAKFRFERGIDPLSIEQGLERAANLIQEICGGVVSEFDIQKIGDIKKKSLKFNPSLFEKITGFNINKKEMITILNNLGFETKEDKELLNVIIPSWRPDIFQEVDVVEELVRIKGYDQIKMIEPEKVRKKTYIKFKTKVISFFTKIYSFQRLS